FKDVISYAEIALDLREYGFAAKLYWFIITSVPENDYDQKATLKNFLFCLQKLNAVKTISNFKVELIEEAKSVEAERIKIMQMSPVYNSFEVKE
ncbi:MAG: hypothetical protein ABIJ97_12145, partial [Bacteroidota bacterium]